MIYPLETDEYQWAHATFGLCSLGDERNTARLIQVAGALALQPERSFNAAFEGVLNERLAAYRFIENDKIQVEDIVSGGVEPVLQLLRERSGKTVLASEDTTNISYLHLSPHEELGPIGGPHDSKMQGFLVHSVFAFDEATGEPLGLLHQHYSTRAKGLVKTPHYERPPSERESYVWQTSSEVISDRLGAAMADVVTLCDKEADIYQLFDYKLQNNQRFVVGSKTNRRLEGHPEKLHDFVRQQPVRATYKLEIAQRGGRKKRTATLEIRDAAVRIKAPENVTDGSRSLDMWALIITEKDPPQNVTPLSWKLLTSEDCSETQKLLKIPQWYSKRWNIEEFHKVWKSGCKVEELQMQTSSNLMRTAAILAFIAVRIYRIEYFARTQPAASCLTILTTAQLYCLWSKDNPKKPMPDAPPPISWAYGAIARLAGWNDSKHTGKASSITLWKGWQRLADLMIGWELARTFSEERIHG